MKRELTEEEVIRFKQSLIDENKRVKDLSEGVWFIEETLKHQRVVWEYDDKMRDYKRRSELDKFDEAKKKIQPELIWASNSAKSFEDILQNGVEIIDNKGGKENE